MNKISQLLKTVLFALVLVIISSGIANGQKDCTVAGVEEGFEDVKSDFKNFKVYPSLAPRSYLKVSYDFLPPGSQFQFDAANQSDYIIVKNGEPAKNRLKIEKIETFVGVKYLVFDAKSNGLKKGDIINVGVCLTQTVGGTTKKVLLWDSANAGADVPTRKQITVPEIELYTLNLTPNVVPNQELTDGNKRTVGQLKFDIDVPSIIRNDKVARFYFNTKNTVSTNWRDPTSKIEMKFGAERSLLRKWYVPISFESKVNGDQRLKNATFVASSGVKTILPWAWTRKGLFNQIIRAPVSPEFTLSAEYHRRLKQDAASLTKFPKKDSFALATEFTWSPIQLFTKKCAKKNVQGVMVEDYESCFSAKKYISLELSGKGWWFPYEKTLTGTKVRRFEGRGEISLLIPVKNIANDFFFKQEGSDIVNAASRIRIKYLVGANDAAGFKRVSQLTFGIELIK
jgi:hypothetical protein